MAKNKFISEIKKIKISLKAKKDAKREEKIDRKVEPKEKAGKVEEIEEFDENQERQERGFIPDFRSAPIEIKAPVLEASSNTVQSLESDVSEAPRTPVRENITETKEVVYVQNAPKYSSDYNLRSYDNREDDFDEMPIRRDIQLDVTQGRLMHKSPVLELNPNINLGLWQRENVFNRGIESTGNQSSPEREYQVLKRKEKKRDDRLPFQQ